MKNTKEVLMVLADYHVHSEFSEDSEAKLADILEQAARLGLEEIALTDHIEFDYPPVSYGGGDSGDFSPPYQRLLAYRQKYQGKIKLILGAEIGLQPQITKEVSQFVKEFKLDFVIGSTHCVDWMDLYEEKLFLGKTAPEAYTRYFEVILNNIRIFDDFDVCGHLDYITRYGPEKKIPIAYADYADIIDEILRLLISKGKGIEVNTSGYRYGIRSPYPQLAILKRYKALGGEIITVGSDAHKPQDIALNFQDAYAILEEAGFTAITLFSQRKPQFVNLP